MVTRRCLTSNGALSKLCPGANQKQEQSKNVTCTNNDCDVTRRSDLKCECPKTVTREENCQFNDGSTHFYSYDCQRNSKIEHSDLRNFVVKKWGEWRRKEKMVYRLGGLEPCKMFVEVICPGPENEGWNQWMILLIIAIVVLVLAIVFAIVLKWKLNKLRRNRSESKTEDTDEFSGFHPPPSARVSFVVTTAEGREVLKDVFQPADRKTLMDEEKRERFPTPRRMTNNMHTRDYAPSLHYKTSEHLLTSVIETNSPKYDQVPRSDDVNADDVIYTQIQSEYGATTQNPVIRKSQKLKICADDQVIDVSQYMDMNSVPHTPPPHELTAPIKVGNPPEDYYSTVNKYLRHDQIESVTTSAGLTLANSGNDGDYVDLNERVNNSM